MAERNTILLIDDDPNMLRLNTRILEREGYYVLAARSLKEANGLINGVVLHAAILEMQFDDGSGLELCRELRSPNSRYSELNPALFKIPIVFLTAMRRLEDKRAAYAAGADDFITKPFRIDQLTDSIRSLLYSTMYSKEEHRKM